MQDWSKHIESWRRASPAELAKERRYYENMRDSLRKKGREDLAKRVQQTLDKMDAEVKRS